MKIHYLAKSFIFFHVFVIFLPFLACPSLAGESLFCLRFVFFPRAWCCDRGCTVVERKNECARLGRKDKTATLRYLMTGCSQVRRMVQGFGSEEERKREKENTCRFGGAHSGDASVLTDAGLARLVCRKEREGRYGGFGPGVL